MAKRHSTNGRNVPAVAYYRMSSDKQETSIPAQRRAVERYANENGYKIVREYVDEGISGDATDKRRAFQQMIADAKECGDFHVVLCWDQSRFGRFDSLEAGYWIFPLIQAGVTKLVTVADGEIDWGCDEHRMLYGIKQDAGMRRYLTDLARNVTRGLIERAKTGAWVGGTPPYGYEVDDDGHLTLGDPKQIQCVRRIFELRLQNVGYRSIAKVINREGYRTAKNGTWAANSIKNVLDRKSYIGNLVFPERPVGKYFSASDGLVVAKNGNGQPFEFTPITILDAHPAIIDKETFDAVQRIRSRDRRAWTRGDSEGTPLAGLLFCGNCGGRMNSCKDRRKSNRTGYRYRCSTYHSGQGCGCCEVPQDLMLEVLANKIREHVLQGSRDRLEKAIRDEIKRRETKHRSVDKGALKRKLAGIDRKIDNATDRLVSVDDSLVPRIEEKLLQLQSERDTVCAELNAPTAKRKKLDAKTVAEEIWKLDEILKNGSASKVRNALSQIVRRVTLHFRRGEMYRNHGYRWHVERGEIELCSKECSNQ